MGGDFLSSLWTAHTPLDAIVLRLGAAIFFGTVIGLDRELRQKAAGLRTHMLISLAAATFTLLTFELVYRLDAAGTLEDVRTDPIRIIEAVIAGVAFLGAGSIIQSGANVRGVTTGASMWLVGAIGLACGAGILDIALIAFVFGFTILTVIGWLESHLVGAGREEDSSRGP